MHIRPNGTVSNKLRVYADAMKAVAAQKAVPLVDLNTASQKLYESLGVEGTAMLGTGPSDRTHFSPHGAGVIANIVASELAVAVPELKPYIRQRKVCGGVTELGRND